MSKSVHFSSKTTNEKSSSNRKSVSKIQGLNPTKITYHCCRFGYYSECCPCGIFLELCCNHNHQENRQCDKE